MGLQASNWTEGCASSSIEVVGLELGGRGIGSSWESLMIAIRTEISRVDSFILLSR
jgi:hypothetical protein